MQQRLAQYFLVRQARQRKVGGKGEENLQPLSLPPHPQTDEERDRAGAAAASASAASSPALAAAAADKERRYRETLAAITTERERSDAARARADETAADLSERLEEKEGRAAAAHAAFAELKRVTASGAGACDGGVYE